MMKILHYFLGFPPYRTGGLTKYAYDLMRAQIKDNNRVSALWPGEIKKIGSAPFIKRRRTIEEIENYELINPLPVSLDEGISEFEAYVKACDEAVYIKFFKDIEVDVIHIHTLMGLHQEFVVAANRLNIKTVFTTHDYFGICPKVTLYRYGSVCENNHDCIDCVQCNNNPLTLKTIQIMQSPLYRALKNSVVIRKLRKRHRSNFYLNETLPDMPNVDFNELSYKYRELRSYYLNMVERIDIIHFNSSLAEAIYKNYIRPKSSKVITISHKGIQDNRNKNKWEQGEKLRIVCLAPATPFKGFKILKQALDEMWNSGKQDFELRMYSPVQEVEPYMIVKEDGYEYRELESILAEADILVAPSVWYETFGFTVLEALSYGVPVVVSSHVGAKDVVGSGGIVFESGNSKSLKEALTCLSKSKLCALRECVKKEVRIKSWDCFLEEIYSLYVEE